MSASLVGSEMCIRDSHRHPFTRPPGGRSGRSRALPPSDNSEGAVDAARPVSYTHLTLPTICSV
eukprot:3667807-Alexandrium_andersonii.AAC.1